ncbi:DUF4406 domain-containing protein [uncultured Bacteroides sp.]|uniref:DUF4406 domain-containing protein n=1 Tax=uncultured Bacteroides sp. TaxID=162156 RepID=UPI00260F7465|nr:DUF4406 domain-containing protein [uncultured Bacteroides sp.]
MEKKNKIPRRKRCYNSGKIGGINYLHALRKFRDADNIIHTMGMHPVNPMNNGLKPSRPYWMHMAVDILMLATCGNIFLQKDWRQSRGARIEYRIARFMGLTVWEGDNRGIDK